ncbi:vomeronasal type-2 receptor 116-like [Sigmodon hispidus]
MEMKIAMGETSIFQSDVLGLESNIYQFTLAFIFAIEEINRNTYILPNISLGFEIYHIHRGQWDSMNEAFSCLTGRRKIIPNYTCRRKKKAASLITGTTWEKSARIGRLMNLYKYPQLSFGPFDTILSDRVQFSSLYQTAPTDSSMPEGIVMLMVHFRWTWVGLVLIDDHKGAEVQSTFKREMDRKRVCVAFVEMIPESSNSIVIKSITTSHQNIMKSFANVVILYGANESKHGIMLLMAMNFINWKVWVMNSQWAINIISKSIIFDVFHGSLIFAIHHVEIPDFRKFIQTYNPYKYPNDYYLATIWNMFFNCSVSKIDCKILGNCLPNVSLEMLPRNVWETDMTEESYNVYNSVYAVAHSLHEMTLKEVEIHPYEEGRANIYPWKLHSFLKNIHFKNGAGIIVVLGSQRKLDAEYDILNLWNFPDSLRQKMKVGTFSLKAPQGQKLFLSEHMIQWAIGFTELPRSVCSESCISGFRKSAKEGKPSCCYDCSRCLDNEISNETDMEHCLRCPESHYANPGQNHCLKKEVTFLSYEDPLGKALTYLSLGFSTLTVGVLGVFVKYHYTPIVKANNQALTYILLVTLAFCFLCPLFFIGHPNTATCILQQITFEVLFSVALSTILAKSTTVILAFKITVPGRLVRWIMISRVPNFIIPICTFIQLVLCGIWLSTSPPFIDSDVHSEHGHIIIICNKGSTIAFHSVLGYLCFMALGSYTTAYLSRNLPDTFNEAKFITFSMLVFFAVWINFLPVYHSTRGKTLVAMEVFSILASSIGLLSCIFVPKCYIILLRPHRNVLSHLRVVSLYRIRLLLLLQAFSCDLTHKNYTLRYSTMFYRVTSEFSCVTPRAFGDCNWILHPVPYYVAPVGDSTRLDSNIYQFTLAFIFAIEEINRNTHILPNISLGFEIYHIHRDGPGHYMTEIIIPKYTCIFDEWLSEIGKRKMIPNYTCRRKNKAALITGTTWAISARIGRLLNLYKYPQLHPFLKNIHFKNGAGIVVVLDSQRKLDAEYDILNLWNFPDSLRQKMKVGTFSPKAPQGQKLLLSEHMIQWAIGFTEGSARHGGVRRGFRGSARWRRAAARKGEARLPARARNSYKQQQIRRFAKLPFALL